MRVSKTVSLNKVDTKESKNVILFFNGWGLFKCDFHFAI